MASVKKYNVIYSDGTQVIEGGLPANTKKETVIPIVLIGKDLPEYGEAQNNNFVWILEHFAKNVPPTQPVVGMCWYDKSDSRLKNFTNGGDGTAGDLIKWRPIAYLNNKEPADPVPGELWWDTSKKTLFVCHRTSTSEEDQKIPIGPIDVDTSGSKSTTPTYTYTKNGDDSGKGEVMVLSDEDLEYGKTYSIVLSIIAKEIGSTELALKQGATIVQSWRVKLLLNTYYSDATLSTPNVSIVGEPSVEIIAQSATTAWTIEPFINANSLKVRLFGAPLTATNRVRWIINANYIKL